MERVVLAYSGGLDTSVVIGWIAEETGAEDLPSKLTAQRNLLTTPRILSS